MQHCGWMLGLSLGVHDRCTAHDGHIDSWGANRTRANVDGGTDDVTRPLPHAQGRTSHLRRTARGPGVLPPVVSKFLLAVSKNVLAVSRFLLAISKNLTIVSSNRRVISVSVPFPPNACWRELSVWGYHRGFYFRCI